jgi:hypothetical protein
MGYGSVTDLSMCQVMAKNEPKSTQNSKSINEPGLLPMRRQIYDPDECSIRIFDYEQ